MIMRLLGSLYWRAAASWWRRFYRHRTPRLLAETRELVSAEGASTDFLFYLPHTSQSFFLYRRWLPVITALSAKQKVSILVADGNMQRKFRALTDIPVYLAAKTGDTEFVAKQLNTKVKVYFDLNRRNLSEAGFHDIFHVLLVPPGNFRRRYLNNRIRLFDYALLPDPGVARLAEMLVMDYSAERSAFVVGVEQEQGPELSKHVAFTDRGVDVEQAVAALVEIARRRDEAVGARDADLSARGIVLTRGGEE